MSDSAAEEANDATRLAQPAVDDATRLAQPAADDATRLAQPAADDATRLAGADRVATEHTHVGDSAAEVDDATRLAGADRVASEHTRLGASADEAEDATRLAGTAGTTGSRPQLVVRDSQRDAVHHAQSTARQAGQDAATRYAIRAQVRQDVHRRLPPAAATIRNPNGAASEATHQTRRTGLRTAIVLVICAVLAAGAGVAILVTAAILG